MHSKLFFCIFFVCQIAIEVSSDAGVNSFPSDSYAIPPSSPPLTNNDQIYNPPAISYDAPAPAFTGGNYGSYGNVPAPAATYGGGSTTTTGQTEKKFNLYLVIAGFKIMLLYIGFVLFKLTYLTEFPNRAAAIDKQTFAQIRSLDLDIGTVTHRLVTQLLEGDYDVNKLFRGKQPK